VSLRLDGKVVLVTGAAGGLGRAIAARALTEGARVALADLPGEGLKQTEELLDGGDRVMTLEVDLVDPNQARDLPERVVAQSQRLDALVNNAGVRAVHPLLEHPLDAWERTMAVNLTAPFLLAQAAGRHMVTLGKGKIVNVTSVAATLSFGNRSAYNASKGGLATLTQSMALELGPHNICCNAVAPGVVETPLNQHYFSDEDFAALIRSNTPCRGWGSPDDVAGAVVFLCTDDADFISGTTIHVDGGWSTGKGY
jgi:gluconate 5-dehydrogenase